MGVANSKRSGGGGDRVIESRHLIGVFLGVVVLCGVFFTLGYVMGRTEPDSGLGLIVTANKSAGPSRPGSNATKSATPAGPAANDWDFFPTGDAGKAETETPGPVPKIAPASQPIVPPAASTPAKLTAKTPARFRPPLIPRGAYLLQVAALGRESDALGLADALQQKHFPAFVLAPTADNLYRVQVGPYADGKSAEIAKHSLEREGFKTILKR